MADATTGPSLATLVTPVSVALPAAANDEPMVQVRIITTNAVGNDEWVGIDDIAVTASPIDQAAGGRSRRRRPMARPMSPSDANISVTFSEPVDVAGDWFTIVCAHESGNHTAAVVSGGPSTFTLDPGCDFVHARPAP